VALQRRAAGGVKSKQARLRAQSKLGEDAAGPGVARGRPSPDASEVRMHKLVAIVIAGALVASSALAQAVPPQDCRSVGEHMRQRLHEGR
jgi:hypothetical protein